jgi:hypothetical protein
VVSRATRLKHAHEALTLSQLLGPFGNRTTGMMEARQWGVGRSCDSEACGQRSRSYSTWVALDNDDSGGMSAVGDLDRLAVSSEPSCNRSGALPLGGNMWGDDARFSPDIRRHRTCPPWSTIHSAKFPGRVISTRLTSALSAPN